MLVEEEPGDNLRWLTSVITVETDCGVTVDDLIEHLGRLPALPGVFERGV